MGLDTRLNMNKDILNMETKHSSQQIGEIVSRHTYYDSSITSEVILLLDKIKSLLTNHLRYENEIEQNISIEIENNSNLSNIFGKILL